jgi:hypothetical protein
MYRRRFALLVLAAGGIGLVIGLPGQGVADECAALHTSNTTITLVGTSCPHDGPQPHDCGMTSLTAGTLWTCTV